MPGRTQSRWLLAQLQDRARVGGVAHAAPARCASRRTCSTSRKRSSCSRARVRSRLVGIGEVREDPLDLHVPHVERRLEQPLGAVPVHADALHAGVDLQVHPRALAERARRTRRSPRSLSTELAVKRQVVLDEQRDLRADDAAEHEHRHPDALLAQAQPLFEIRHARRRARRSARASARSRRARGRTHWPSGSASRARDTRARRARGSCARGTRGRLRGRSVAAR